MTKDNTTRRKILLGIGTAATAGLAGCNDTGENGTETATDTGTPGPEDFDYPEGFSSEGIEDFSTALGQESTHYNASTVGIDGQYVVEDQDGNEINAQNLTVRVNGDEQMQYFRGEDEQVVQEQYQAGGTQYVRSYLKQKDEEQFDVRQDVQFRRGPSYGIDLLRVHLNPENVQEYDVEVVGENRVKYTVVESNFADTHGLYQQYQSMTDATVELTIYGDGRLDTMNVEVVTQNQDGNPITNRTELEFSYDVTVDEPDWLSDAKEAAQQTETATETATATETPTGKMVGF